MFHTISQTVPVMSQCLTVPTLTTATRFGRPKILSERDERHLIKITKENQKNTLEELTEKFNTIMKISVSSRTIQRTLHKADYSGHAAKKKPLISEKNWKK